MTESKRALKVFLCHIIPVGYAHADRDPVPQGDDIPQGDDVRGLPEGTRLTTLVLADSAREDGVDAWLDKEKLHGERSRTILLGQGFDTASLVNLPDWELEIRKAV